MNNIEDSKRKGIKERSLSERRFIIAGAIISGIFSVSTFIIYRLTAEIFANRFHSISTYIMTFIGGPFIGGLVAEIGVVQKAPRWLIIAIIVFLGLCFPLCLCSYSVMFMDQ
jgi:hypothetical protein